MVLTKATVITWATWQDQDNNYILNEARTNFIIDAYNVGKTDAVYDVITDVITKRYWLDQASAEEYKQFIISETSKLGITRPTVQIVDNA